jgi:hypothetical protein
LVFIWQTYYGYYILYPFTILGTWFHEMGHGVMAIAMGGKFLYLEIFPNGAGLAHNIITDKYLSLKYARALVSAAGLFGPPVVGSILILMSKSFRKSKVILYFLSICMLVSVVIWVRTPVGIVVISSLGLLFLVLAIKAKDSIKQFVVQIIGLMACVDTYKQIGYLYMGRVTVDGSESFSDTGQIANQLGLTYSFWGTFILIMSFLLLLTSLYYRNRTAVKKVKLY